MKIKALSDKKQPIIENKIYFGAPNLVSLL